MGYKQAQDLNTYLYVASLYNNNINSRNRGGREYILGMSSAVLLFVQRVGWWRGEGALTHLTGGTHSLSGVFVCRGRALLPLLRAGSYCTADSSFVWGGGGGGIPWQVTDPLPRTDRTDRPCRPVTSVTWSLFRSPSADPTNNSNPVGRFFFSSTSFLFSSLSFFLSCLVFPSPVFPALLLLLLLLLSFPLLLLLMTKVHAGYMMGSF